MTEPTKCTKCGLLSQAISLLNDVAEDCSLGELRAKVAKIKVFLRQGSVASFGEPAAPIQPEPPEVGVAVSCSVCGLRKKPVGRSAPLEMANSLCDDGCEGYRQEPYPGQLWPGETREEFGF